MSVLPSSTFPAATSCSRLAQMKSLSWDVLYGIAQNWYKSSDRAILKAAIESFSYKHDAPSATEQLAELLYFRQGYCLAADGRLTEITIAQAQHEILVRGLRTKDELPTDHLALCFIIWSDNKEIAKQSFDSGYHSDTSDNSDRSSAHSSTPQSWMQEEEEADEEQSDSTEGWRHNGGYIQSWDPRTRRFTRFRY